MNLEEKLEALMKQSEELKNMFMKVQGAIELTQNLINEGAEESVKEEKEEKEEPKKK